MDTVLQDFRYGLRRLVAHKGLTAIAVLSLAVGIGANTTIFSAVDTILLRALPYDDADRLVQVWMSIEGRGDRFSNTLPDVLDLDAETGVFESVTAYRGMNQNLTGGDRPERVLTIAANASLFSTLRTQPMLGRAFTAEDDRPGAADRVAVLGHTAWENRFGGDPTVVGRTIRLSDVEYTVIGVMPPGFDFPYDGVDIYTPLRQDATTWSRASGGINAIARLGAGVDVERARMEAGALAARLGETYPETNADRGYSIEPLAAAYYGSDLRLILLVLLGAVGFVLLIACANVANLLLARAVGRDREIAVRAAIGAGRLRVVRQLLTESIVLALAGGALGVLLAAWGTGLLATAVPDGMVYRIDQIGIDGRVLLFTVAVSVLTGLLFGLAPALRASRVELTAVLRDGGRGGSAGRSRGRLLRGLVAAQVALAVVLLVGAGLMIRSLTTLMAVDPGFDAERILVLDYSLGSRYTSAEETARFQHDVLARIEALPGIDAAGVVNTLPVGGTTNYDDILIEGMDPPDGRPFNTGSLVVSPGYFRAMGIALRDGRAFDARDVREGPGVAVVNRAMAERYWPGEDPIGRRVAFTWDTDGDRPYWRTIVGVVEDSRFLGLHADPRPEMYVPFAQTTWPTRQATIAVHVAGGTPAGVAQAVQSEVWAVDADAPLFRVRAMSDIVRDHGGVSLLRTATGLLGIFGALALLLASVGLYGVLAYTVAQRTHEIGIRNALGANHGAVLRLIVGEGLRTVAVGLGVGILAALALTRLMASLLFGVQATDPLTFAGVVLVLGTVAALAAYVPARRALRVDPVVALRAE